ncbi:myelin-oligodendrocyte glycoprotein [Sinocyclocheilus grahami]|uniref:myelin-oligodendrocyte glycoprotein n=1 Tax=Sinocyclocheilus grahami TaxID=75366 RepID=UPI0007AC9F98|nr:PREDICTED: myelin-oligodendrocyte glycoprotein-like [Sinocyclocheilus grahami]
MSIMLKSALLVCFFILLLNEASVQDIVQGFIRDSALLPCESGQLKVNTAHWRYNDSKNVYDILNGQGTTKEQDAEYKGRTETFPAEYSKGNFSLRLGNLQKRDEGSYCCFIPNAEFDLNKCINLQVREKPRGIQEKPGSNSGVETTAERIVSLLFPLFSATVLLCV